jgi:hypothetical protein
MFQCIIQQRNGWIKGSPEMRDVFPGTISPQLSCLFTNAAELKAPRERSTHFLRLRKQIVESFSVS